MRVCSRRRADVSLALAGRYEPRDFVDILFVHETVLRLAGLAWAAVGKDPGLFPLSLLELLKRHGRYRPEELARLHLAEPFDLASAQRQWLTALREAEGFAHERPPPRADACTTPRTQRASSSPTREPTWRTRGSCRTSAGPAACSGWAGGSLPRIADQRLEGVEGG